MKRSRIFRAAYAKNGGASVTHLKESTGFVRGVE